MNSINTIRRLATILWPKGFNLDTKYDRKGRPPSWRKMYSLNNGREWFYCGDLCGKLSAICAKRCN